MSDKSRQMTAEEAAEFTEQVFNVARQGDAQMLDELASSGLPVNLRNHKGDTLLMLASYYGHVDAVQVLLKHKADPRFVTTTARARSPARPSRATWQWSRRWWKAAPRWKVRPSTGVPR